MIRCVPHSRKTTKLVKIPQCRNSWVPRPTCMCMGVHAALPAWANIPS